MKGKTWTLLTRQVNSGYYKEIANALSKYIEPSSTLTARSLKTEEIGAAAAAFWKQTRERKI